MPLLAEDPDTQLAFSVFENKGLYALLLGSGLSRSADIPTGWEITVDLIRRVATAQRTKEQADWAAWYRKKFNEEPKYSEILKVIGSSQEERRSVIHGYIEPSVADREEGRKIPTKAHYAIADMVREGYIKIIVTTNFDRLLESALQARGIEPTVIASVDALAGAEPISRSNCYILKLHGDYKDARILNTEEELSDYPPAYNSLLDRIFDEYGLIISGWSGEWDHALRTAILRAPSRRYPTYWTTRSPLMSQAEALAIARGAKIIAIKDADAFFSDLQEKLLTLEQTRSRNPRSVQLLVNSVKRYLGKPEFRIQLDEIFGQQAELALDRLGASEFEPGDWSQEDFRLRVSKYEAISEPLALMAGVLGRWGGETGRRIIVDLVKHLYEQGKQSKGGLVVHIELRLYPVILIAAAYAIGLTRASNWKTLRAFFDSTVSVEDQGKIRVVDEMFLTAWDGARKEDWKNIEGFESRKTPFSDHIAEVFKRWHSSFAGAVPDFELLLERFELLGMLAYVSGTNKSAIAQALETGPQEYAWMPMGRILWDRERAQKLSREIREEGTRSALLDAGFAQGDPEFFELFMQNFKRLADRFRWM